MNPELSDIPMIIGRQMDAKDFAQLIIDQFDEMLEQARPLLQPKPVNGPLYYNVACAESLAGRHDDALEHLRTGLELRPSLVDLDL